MHILIHICQSTDIRGIAQYALYKFTIYLLTYDLLNDEVLITVHEK